MGLAVGIDQRDFYPATGDHFVQVYRKDDELLSSVSAYALRALRSGEAFIFVATGSHCRRFTRALRKSGIDVKAATASGQLTFIAAEDFLPRFMKGTRPDRMVFEGLVRAVLAQTNGDPHSHQVHVFEEIADVLWRAGNVSGTLQLEELWNASKQSIPFTLYCAFHVDHAPPDAFAGPLAPALRAHNHVVQEAGARFKVVRGALVELAEPERPETAEAARSRGVVTGAEHPPVPPGPVRNEDVQVLPR